MPARRDNADPRGELQRRRSPFTETLEHFRFRLNRKCSRYLSESVIHASLAIPPEAITL
jgi:hypothetical protein